MYVHIITFKLRLYDEDVSGEREYDSPWRKLECAKVKRSGMLKSAFFISETELRQITIPINIKGLIY